MWQQAARRWLDKSTPYYRTRWTVFFGLLALFSLRVWFLQSHAVICYLLAVHLLHILLGVITPAMEPVGGELPTRSDDEYRPFERKIPEFVAWRSATGALVACIAATLTQATDIPAYWPLLLSYFCMLMILTLRDRIAHMLKFRYLPWSVGKQSYTKKSRAL